MKKKKSICDKTKKNQKVKQIKKKTQSATAKVLTSGKEENHYQSYYTHYTNTISTATLR